MTLRADLDESEAIMNPEVDKFVSKSDRWTGELSQLRTILVGCGLTEELKWVKPCYTYNGSNIAIFQPFKESCALMFFKGALLKDSAGVLEKPGANSQAARRIKFRSVAEVKKLAGTIKEYIAEAIEAEKAGLTVSLKTPDQFEVPAEFQSRLDNTPALRKAFAALTPGRQRAYLLHFSAPKRSETRASRVEKCEPRIMAGKGLNDRFDVD